MLKAHTMTLQKYSPACFLKTKAESIRISIVLYQAIAAKAVIALGIVLLAP